MHSPRFELADGRNPFPPLEVLPKTRTGVGLQPTIPRAEIAAGGCARGMTSVETVSWKPGTFLTASHRNTF